MFRQFDIVLLGRVDGRILVGTWKAADWAIRFYAKNGFQLTGEEEKNRLLKTYWNIPHRQIETSVVLIHREPADSGNCLESRDHATA